MTMTDADNTNMTERRLAGQDRLKLIRGGDLHEALVAMQSTADLYSELTAQYVELRNASAAVAKAMNNLAREHAYDKRTQKAACDLFEKFNRSGLAVA